MQQSKRCGGYRLVSPAGPASSRYRSPSQFPKPPFLLCGTHTGITMDTPVTSRRSHVGFPFPLALLLLVPVLCSATACICGPAGSAHASRHHPLPNWSLEGKLRRSQHCCSSRAPLAS